METFEKEWDFPTPLWLALACIGSIFAFAADILTPAESVKTDVDKVKFTHKEWTGIDYKDADGKAVTGEDVFGIHREDASVQNHAEAEKFMGKNGFRTASFVKKEADGWKSAAVPISWTMPVFHGILPLQWEGL